jgi:glycosyltransferase involved in cell wall biosynthesis
MKDILFSVITPSYNSGKYLEETILSVINQTYKNFEFILIDGGSTDNTLDIVSKYEKHFTYWVSEKDNGQTNAINKGFRKAKGDLVTWICADDLYYPDTLMTVADYIHQHTIFIDTVGVIYGQSLNFKDDGFSSVSYGGDINLKQLLHYDPNVLQIASFHSRKILEQIGYLDESLNYCMDYDLWIRMLQKGDLYFIDKLIGKFRLHDESKTVSQKGLFAWEILKKRYMYSKNPFSPINYLLIRRILTNFVKTKIIKTA